MSIARSQYRNRSALVRSPRSSTAGRGIAWAVLLVIAISCETSAVLARASELCDDGLTASIPERAKDALTGSEFATSIWSLNGRARDAAVIREVAKGNIPNFLRELRPVTLTFKDRKGAVHTARVCVMPDYLAVGSDADFVRMPLGLAAATEAARAFEFILPTRKLVDAIYQQSDLQLVPESLEPGPKMVTTEYLVEHNKVIETQRGEEPVGQLVSGHKKDVVLTKRLLTRRGRVAIYGWHEKAGKPIQPLSTVHGARYADYSHGVRLVSASIVVDEVERSVYDVLGDATLAGTLTHEGTIKDARRLMGVASPAR